eukprot:GHVU01080484.1.p1 GENE.GHVU01080484.1~~GHVU01080484.1.p1  ORF type:complete len:111 (-),score=6.84 GHVU01080484.1:52-384(-)
MIVSATEPATKVLHTSMSIPSDEMDKSIRDWLTTIKEHLDKNIFESALKLVLGERYVATKALEQCGVHVYMRDRPGSWNLLTDKRIYRLPVSGNKISRFFVTGDKGTWPG